MKEIQFNAWVGKICSEGHDEPLQYSCLGNLMDRGGQQAAFRRVTKSMEHLNQLSLHRHTYIYLFLYKFFFHLCCYRISSRVACGFVVGPCWLFILYIVVSIYMLIPKFQSSPRPNLPFGNHQLGLYVDVFLMFFRGGSLII